MSSEEQAICAVIDAMYASISGPAGPRDWTRQREIFHPDARQMRTVWDESGKPSLKIMTLDEYRENVTPFFNETPFFEVEIARRIDVLGAMAHAWSLYEARNAPDDTIPERRGINSIQLMREASGRWRIISMIWDNERGDTKAAPF
ncbi:MAG: hypothetical protein AB7P07_14105 [Hyphomonadaceae bacterium]